MILHHIKNESYKVRLSKVEAQIGVACTHTHARTHTHTHSTLQTVDSRILPSSAAIFGFAIDLSILTVLCWCSRGSKLVADNSDYIRLSC